MTREPDVDGHIESERARYNNHFQGVADRNVNVSYGVEVSSSDQHGDPRGTRMLAPGGRAVLMEPQSENRLLDLARDHLPYPGTKSPTGHRGMSFEMIERSGTYFSDTRAPSCYLPSMINRPLGQRTAITPLERLDDAINRCARASWKLCSYVVITFEREAASAP